MEFGYTRRVQENYIDLDRMSKDGRIDREVEGSPNGYYPVVVVPQYLIGKKVLIIPVSEENIPLDLVNNHRLKPVVSLLQADKKG